jgi:hypothetical protein
MGLAVLSHMGDSWIFTTIESVEGTGRRKQEQIERFGVRPFLSLCGVLSLLGLSS